MDEEQLHRACAEWAAWQSNGLPELALLHHSPNGGKRPKGEAGKMKGMGTKPGFPDFFLPVPRARYHGLFIELKVGKNKLSPAQAWWFEQLKARGYSVWECRSNESFESIVLGYLELWKQT